MEMERNLEERDVSVQLHKNIEKSPRKWNSSCKIEDEDFHVKFEWSWKMDPPVLKHKINCYISSLTVGIRKELQKNVEKWINEAILLPWGRQEDVEIRVRLLMAVVQQMKGKAWPVLDFWQIYGHMICHPYGDCRNICVKNM